MAFAEPPLTGHRVGRLIGAASRAELTVEAPRTTLTQWALRLLLLVLLPCFPLIGIGPVPPKAAGALWIVLAVAALLMDWRRGTNIAPIHWVVLAYAGVWIMSIVASPFPTAATVNFVPVIAWTVMTVATQILLPGKEGTLWLALGFVIAALVVTAISLSNVFTGQQITAQPGNIDVNDAALYPAVATFLLYGLIREQRSWLVKLAGIAGILAFLADIGLSLSRGAMVGVAAGFVLLFVRERRERPPLLVSAITATVLALVATPYWLPKFSVALQEKGVVAGGNVTSRVEAWGVALNEWAIRPVLGNGMDTLNLFISAIKQIPPGAFVVSYAHNTFIEVLYSTGVIGFAIMAAIVGYAAIAAWTWSRAPQSRNRGLAGLQRSLVPALASLAACAFFTSQITYPPLWLILAMSLGVARGTAPRDRSTRAIRPGEPDPTGARRGHATLWSPGPVPVTAAREGGQS